MQKERLADGDKENLMHEEIKRTQDQVDQLKVKIDKLSEVLLFLSK